MCKNTYILQEIRQYYSLFLLTNSFWTRFDRHDCQLWKINDSATGSFNYYSASRVQFTEKNWTRLIVSVQFTKENWTRPIVSVQFSKVNWTRPMVSVQFSKWNWTRPMVSVQFSKWNWTHPIVPVQFSKWNWTRPIVSVQFNKENWTQTMESRLLEGFVYFFIKKIWRYWK